MSDFQMKLVDVTVLVRDGFTIQIVQVVISGQRKMELSNSSETKGKIFKWDSEKECLVEVIPKISSQSKNEDNEKKRPTHYTGQYL